MVPMFITVKEHTILCNGVTNVWQQWRTMTQKYTRLWSHSQFIFVIVLLCHWFQSFEWICYPLMNNWSFVFFKDYFYL